MYCSNCGHKLEDDAVFCSECGTKSGKDIPESVEGAKAEETQEVPDVSGIDVIDGNTEKMTETVYAAKAPAASNIYAPAADEKTDDKKKSSLPVGIAIGVAAVLVVLAAIFATLFFTGFFDDEADGVSGQSSGFLGRVASGDQGAGGNSEAPIEQTSLDIYVPQVDNSAFPKVTMYAQMVDAQGQAIESVDTSYFTLAEFDAAGNKYVGTIDEIAPVALGDAMNINLVIDQSGSMDERSKMMNAKQAANVFVGEITKNDSNSTEITAFDSYVYNVQPFTTDSVLLSSAIDSLLPQGQTALYDALYWSIQRTNLKSGSRVVIAFTDGAENASYYSKSDVIELSNMTGIPVYVIGIGDEIERSDLTELASSCNGQYFDAATDDLAHTLESIYSSIYSEQRNMYRVVFTSSYSDNKNDYRTVRLDTAENSPYFGTFERSYVPVDNIPMYESYVVSNDYVLPDSSSRYLFRGELENLSLWELYLARNEIFARHGRGFNNQDLVDYFATRTWYSEYYSPDQFDAMKSPLNDYELKNVELMLAIEKERNSPYTKTIK